MTVASISAFERLFFDGGTVTVDRNGLDLPALGLPLSDEDIAHLSGAPAGAQVICELRLAWSATEVGSDRPDPGLYFRVIHTSIPGYNHVGICKVAAFTGGPPYLRMYLKDVSLVRGVAPPGMAGTKIARIARRCLLLGISSMRLLAAGGRLWANRPDGARWAGFYAWPRYGFNMPLHPLDLAILGQFPFYPAHLSGHPPCTHVQDVTKSDDGLAWWRLCGSGDFMEFDCSSPFTASIAVLDNTLAGKGI